jgi:hypothetical protein
MSTKKNSINNGKITNPFLKYNITKCSNNSKSILTPTKMYKIKIVYQTKQMGSTDTEIAYLDVTFKSLKLAKANLLRIKEHYEMQGELMSDSKEQIIEKYGVKDWFVFSDNRFLISCVKLLLDNGNSFTQYSDWTGYYDNLIEIKIELVGTGLAYSF